MVDPDLQIGGGGGGGCHPDPEIRKGGLKEIFSTLGLGASAWSKNKGRSDPSPGSATDEYQWIRNDLG